MHAVARGFVLSVRVDGTLGRTARCTVACVRPVVTNAINTTPPPHRACRAPQVQAQMSLPPHSCFQFFGLDFLVDAGCKAWLLEANATPSMKVRLQRRGLLKV